MRTRSIQTSTTCPRPPVASLRGERAGKGKGARTRLGHPPLEPLWVGERLLPMAVDLGSCRRCRCCCCRGGGCGRWLLWPTGAAAVGWGRARAVVGSAGGGRQQLAFDAAAAAGRRRRSRRRCCCCCCWTWPGRGRRSGVHDEQVARGRRGRVGRGGLLLHDGRVGAGARWRPAKPRRWPTQGRVDENSRASSINHLFGPPLPARPPARHQPLPLLIIIITLPPPPYSSSTMVSPHYDFLIKLLLIGDSGPSGPPRGVACCLESAQESKGRGAEPPLECVPSVDQASASRASCSASATTAGRRPSSRRSASTSR